MLLNLTLSISHVRGCGKELTNRTRDKNRINLYIIPNLVRICNYLEAV